MYELLLLVVIASIALVLGFTLEHIYRVRLKARVKIIAQQLKEDYIDKED